MVNASGYQSLTQGREYSLERLGVLNWKKMVFIFIIYYLHVVFLPLFCLQMWRHGVMNCVGSSLEMNNIHKLPQIDRSLII